MKWERVHGKARARETPEGKKSAGRKGGIWGPRRRWGHTCNAIKGGRYLYVFGGYGNDNCQTNDVHVFDTVKQTWSKPMMKGIPPSPRDSHTCTTVGNNLFVFGGTDGSNPLKDLHILDTSSNTWISPSIHGKGPDAREGHSAALVDKRLFIFGGCGKSRDNPEELYYNDLYILDTENLVWECAVTSGTPPSARDSHTCSSWRNKLIVLGGEDSSDYYLSDVYILDTDTLAWNELSTSGQMLAPRAGHSTVALGRNLFVFGGFTDDRNLYDDLHILNVDTGIWSRVPSLNPGPSARFSAAGDCLDAQRGILVFIGGCNASLEALDDMYYLHTGLSVENRKAENRQEKFSLRKELKNKCQENCFSESRTEMKSELPKLDMEPDSSRAGVTQDNCDSESSGERKFKAIVTGNFPDGFTIETCIDGKLLRGVVFSQKPNVINDTHASVNSKRMKTAAAAGVLKLNGRHQTTVDTTKNAHQATTNCSQEPKIVAQGKESTSQDSPIETPAAGKAKLVSAADEEVLKSLEHSSVPQQDMKDEGRSCQQKLSNNPCEGSSI